MNLKQIWRDNIENFGSYPVFICEGQSYTNVQCDEEASQLAHVLLGLGVKQGDRVVTVMPNAPDVVIAFSGIVKCGAVIVPVMPLLQAPEIRYIVADCHPKVILTTEALFAKVQEAVTGLASPPAVYTLGGASSPASLRKQLEEMPQTAPNIVIDEANEAALLYTAGTTGHPKGVVLTHKNLCSNAAAAAKTANVLKLRKERVSLGVLPFSHSFGFTMLNVALMLGDTSVLLPHFEPAKVLEAIETYKVTHAAMVPAMIHELSHYPEADKYDTSSFIACISGSAALSPHVAKKFQQTFSCVVMEGYGLSEAGPIVTATDPLKPIKAGSVGLPLPGVEVAVVDEDGNRLPANEVGELIVSGPNISEGYYRKPEASGKVFRRKWLYTGDMARIDEEGYVFIVDRKKDVIIRGGFNIYPRDLEELLMSHPAVTDAGVVGVPSEKMGEEVAAYVVVSRDADVTEEMLIGFCQERLAKYKTPRFLKIVAHLPKNVIGKTDKKILREWAEEFSTARQS